MHIIARKTLKEYWEKDSRTEASLKAWYSEAKNAQWDNSAELKQQYRSASIINAERVVFNVCGNKYRLVVRINYASHTVFIRFIGTHKEYERIDVEEI